MSNQILFSALVKSQRFKAKNEGKIATYEAHENAHRYQTPACKCPEEKVNYFNFSLLARDLKTQAMVRLYFRVGTWVELVK